MNDAEILNALNMIIESRAVMRWALHDHVPMTPADLQSAVLDRVRGRALLMQCVAHSRRLPR